jgi:hypothetical protein
MKIMTYISNHLTRGTLVVAVAGLAVLGNSALAQEKGAERLVKLNRPAAAPKSQAAAPTTAPMPCAKCQDVVQQVPDWSAKGGAVLMAGGQPTKLEVRHLCEGCATAWSTVGHGKAKQDVATHTCTSCGADSKSCCSTAKNGRAKQ